MPNPVDKYALNYVKENIGVEERELEALENTSRYELPALVQVILNFGTRSMNGKAIIYPYWENVARGYEDILALILIFRAIFILYPIVLVVSALFIAWKHRTWTSKTVYLYLKDKGERRMEKLRAARQRRKAKPAKEKTSRKGLKKKEERSMSEAEASAEGCKDEKEDEMD